MDFGDILNEWDTETAKSYGKKRLKEDARRLDAEEKGDFLSDKNLPAVKKSLPKAHPVDVWLRRYGIHDKDTVLSGESECATPAQERKRKHALKSEAVVDLHGCTRDEAWIRLETFFADCHRRGLQKILIIHGKGTHSDGGSVLLSLVKQFIEKNTHAGESGFSRREDGGSGSTWVLLK